jgi:hypothetical protein
VTDVKRGPHGRSSVDTPENEVETADGGDQVGNEFSFGHLRERREVVETGASDLEARR